MNLLSAEEIVKSYSDKSLFHKISLGINEGDKIGLIGVNGTGKSTFLKILAGVEHPDEGRVIVNNSIRLEYLPQNPVFDLNATIIEEVFKGNLPEMVLLREYEKALEKSNNSDEIIKLNQKMDQLNAWVIESEAKAILTKLGLYDFNTKIGNLSGGQRKRVALAKALIQPSDLLILDEPTNHLDNDTIDWLEQYLNKRNGSLLMVTHDRYFLDRIVNEIIEIDQGHLYQYQGNYSIFLEKKAEREEQQAANFRKKQNLYRNELAWIRRGAQARSTKQKARIDRFEALSEQLVKDASEQMEISIGSTRLGKKVIEIDNLSKTIEDKLLIKDFTYIVSRTDRIGIVGPNGSGKSTLMNLIAGIIQPSQGSIEWGQTVKIGYYKQETLHLDEAQRAMDYITEASEMIETSDGFKITASQMMERFLFSGAMQYAPIGKLSGGERRRLYLLRILMEAPNVLLLDEPTNDLDIETLSILEDYLEEFPGAVLSVSHDRYFLDRIAHKIFFFEGNGTIKEYTGNYSEFKERLTQDQIIKNETKDITNKKTEQKREKLKFSFKEKKEYEEIDQIIAELEEQIQKKENEVNNASSDYLKLQALLKELAELQKQYDEKMERWLYLNDLKEKIEAQ